MTPTSGEAKRFFIEKIVTGAERQDVSLSDNERRMLNWSEVEPGCVADLALAEALAREISDDAYEAKICRLLEAAYERDVTPDEGAKDAYRRAYSVPKGGRLLPDDNDRASAWPSAGSLVAILDVVDEGAWARSRRDCQWSVRAG